ncbi:MAG: methyltransferase domain-containing protein [Oscillospiraceae bacterium]|nr:methyltransferase domain-containing protein [Oscillospiraceae bacterium]
MSKAYGIFAQFYDTLTSNIDYAQRAQYFDSVVRKFGRKQGGILLDLACGTGSLSEQMDALGYDVIAVDNSPEMLGIAMEKKFDSGRNIQYLCQDMRELDMFGTIDVTVCALDSLNHLDSFEDVKRVFEKVFLFCEPGGLFIFDINTEYKHKMILGDNTFIYDTDDVYCVWQNSCENSRVKIELDFFVPENGVYRRYEESFCENAYPLNDVENALKETGFEILMCCDGDSDKPVCETTQRAVFAVRKPC